MARKAERDANWIFGDLPLSRQQGSDYLPWHSFRVSEPGDWKAFSELCHRYGMEV